MASVAEVFVDTLIENGVTHVCGVQDDSPNAVTDAIQ